MMNAFQTVVLLLLLGLVAIVLAAATPEEAMLTETNNYRTSRGLGLLAVDTRLATAALKHNNLQVTANLMSHSLPGDTGADAGARITVEGYEWGAYAENVGTFSCDAAIGIGAWKNSAPHNANMLGSFVHVGFACSLPRAQDGLCFWTAVYASPLSGRAEETGSAQQQKKHTVAPGAIAAIVIAAVLIAAAVVAVAATVYLRRRKIVTEAANYNAMNSATADA